MPTAISSRPSRSAVAMRCASAGTRKRSDWPGPVWLNGRTRTSSSPYAEVRLQREERRRDLAHAVRRDRAQRRVLAQRQVGSVDAAVLLGAADDDHAARRRPRAPRRARCAVPSTLTRSTAVGSAPRLADVREAPRGGTRPRAGARRERVVDRVAVGDVERIGARAVERRRRRRRLARAVRGEVRADESARRR